MNHRRLFLAALGALPISGVQRTWAQGTMPHGSVSMPMSMQGMHGMSNPTAARLALVEALPSGAPLAELVRLVNTSTQPGLYRATLTAAPVKLSLIASGETEFWAYNSSLPGPLIEVNEGDAVEILFVNQLPQASTIHWHGLPVPSDQDGNPHDAVPAGDKRLYRFILPMGSAGTYWYHPHPHGHTAEQVFRGLAGTFIVRAKDDPLKSIPERLLVCSDLKLLANGQIADNDANDKMNGREGQYALINAQRQPVVAFAAGGRERWRIWNANCARYLRLQLPGVGLTLVGTDGGLLEHPVAGLTELLMAPAERIEVIVDAPAKAGQVMLTAVPYERGKMGDVAPEAAIDLLKVDFDGVRDHRQTPLPENLRQIADLGAPKAHKRIVFSEKMSMAGGVHNMQFLVNDKSFDMQRIDLASRIGDVELWEIVNESDMDHPFHIHGTQFQVIERQMDDKVTSEPYRAWRDMVNLRSGESVRIKLRQDFKGLRLYHCHILEHEDAGMMGQVDVI